MNVLFRSMTFLSLSASSVWPQETVTPQEVSAAISSEATQLNADAEPSTAPIQKTPLTEMERLHREMEKFVGTWTVIDADSHQQIDDFPFKTLWFDIEGNRLLSETSQNKQIISSLMTLDVRETPYRFRMDRQPFPEGPQEVSVPHIGVYAFEGTADGSRQLTMNLSYDGNYPKSIHDNGQPQSAGINLVLRRIPDANSVDAVKIDRGRAEEITGVITPSLQRKLKHRIRLGFDVRSNSILVPRHYQITDEVREVATKYQAFAYRNHVPTESTTGERPAVKEDASDNEAARLVIQLQDELTVLQQSTEPTHPKVRQLQARIDAARQTAAATSQNSLPTRGTLPALQAARQQMEHINDELRLADTNYERMEKLVEVGITTPPELDQARLKVLAARSRLGAVEEQIAAVKERMKVELLRMMEESLSNWLQSGGTEKSGISEREARIPRIIDLVGQSPEEARAAAVEFANELDRESIERIEAEVASAEQQIDKGEAHPFSGTFQEQRTRRLAELRRGLRARSLLSGTDYLHEGQQQERPQASFAQSVSDSELISFTEESIAELRRQFDQADQQTRALARSARERP